MPLARRCPECGGTEFKSAGDHRLQCLQCGATLAYSTNPAAVILTWAIFGALLGAASNLVARALGVEWSGAARWIPVFLLIAVLSNLVSRRFRRLRKV